MANDDPIEPQEEVSPSSSSSSPPQSAGATPKHPRPQSGPVVTTGHGFVGEMPPVPESLDLGNEVPGPSSNHGNQDSPMRALCVGGKLSASSENLNQSDPKSAAKRKSKTLTFRKKKVEPSSKDKKSGGATFWSFNLKKHLPARLRRGKEHGLPDAQPPAETTSSTQSCVCTGYKRTEDHVLGPGLVFAAQAAARVCGATASPLQPNSSRTARLAFGAGPGPTGMHRYNPQLLQLVPVPPASLASAPTTTVSTVTNPPNLIDFSQFNPEEYPTEDVDELLIAQRARDMELGIEISPNHVAYPNLRYSMSSSSGSSSSGSSNTLAEQVLNLCVPLQNQCVVTTTTYPAGSGTATVTSTALSYNTDFSHNHFAVREFASSVPPAPYFPRTVHTQVDYIHCLVPDLPQITGCSFYWGVMDRYEAERLLENRPEGTFLLRDSAQEEFLFSVSFRRYGRSLHARIEQWNHKFSFDSHDPGVFASDTVCGLMEHYKDPTCCMFFEPMLTIPLNRTFPFSLQHLCRSVICGHIGYDGINFLPLPKPLREYLKYYHYKQKVRVRCFEMQH